MTDLSRTTTGLIERAAALSRARHGRSIGFHVPGLFIYNGRRGRFPGISLTGTECQLNCAHCNGTLLESMLPAPEPDLLLAKARQAARSGAVGLLLSGGCDAQGRLPHDRFCDAIARIKDETDLFVAVHAGFPDRGQADRLKAAGVDLAMIDLIVDEPTLKNVYGLDGADRAADGLAALVEAGLEIAPHVVIGLNGGRLGGEERAIEIIGSSGVKRIVFVVFMPLKGTALAQAEPPSMEEAINLIARARISYPDLVQHLGCAKPRGRYHRDMDLLAVRAGVNHIAIPAPEAVEAAERMGLNITWTRACCAVGSVKEL